MGVWEDVKEKNADIKDKSQYSNLMDKKNGVSSGRNGGVWEENPV